LEILTKFINELSFRRVADIKSDVVIGENNEIRCAEAKGR